MKKEKHLKVKHLGEEWHNTPKEFDKMVKPILHSPQVVDTWSGKPAKPCKKHGKHPCQECAIDILNSIKLPQVEEWAETRQEPLISIGGILEDLMEYPHTGMTVQKGLLEIKGYVDDLLIDEFATGYNQGASEQLDLIAEKKLETPQVEEWEKVTSRYNAEILNKFQDEYLMEKGPGCEQILFPVLEKATKDFINPPEDGFKRDFNFKDYISSLLLQARADERREMVGKALAILTDEINLAHQGEVGGITSRLTSAYMKISNLIKEK